MFKAIIDRLASIVRLDRAVNTKDITVGEIAGDNGEPRVALQLPTSEVVVMEEQGEAALLRQFGVPADHFARLPHELRCHELNHFAKTQARNVMLRTVKAEDDDEHLSLRGCVSSRYSAFDNADVLDAIGNELEGWEVTSSRVDRDEMRIQATMPQVFDVGARQVGDLTRAALTITNHELGLGAASIAFSLYRLVCKNGMTSAEGVAARIRHLWIKREEFVAKLRQAVADAGVQGEAMARLLRRSHDLRITSIDPDGDKLSRAAVRVLRNENLYTQTFVNHVNSQLGPVEEQSLFGVVQVVSDAQRLETLPLLARQNYERAAGRLLQLAAN